MYSECCSELTYQKAGCVDSKKVCFVKKARCLCDKMFMNFHWGGVAWGGGENSFETRKERLLSNLL